MELQEEFEEAAAACEPELAVRQSLFRPRRDHRLVQAVAASQWFRQICYANLRAATR